MRSGFKVSEFHDAAASFGQPIPPKGLRGRAVPAHPVEACRPIQPAPEDIKHNLPMFAVIGMAVYHSRVIAWYYKNLLRNFLLFS